MQEGERAVVETRREKQSSKMIKCLKYARKERKLIKRKPVE